MGEGRTGPTLSPNRGRMNCRQVASRLGVDAHTVARYVLHGLGHRRQQKTTRRIYLRAKRIGRGYDITVQAVNDFRKLRKKMGF